MTRTCAKAAIIATTLSALVLGGCSLARLGYSQAPELGYWWLDGYLDFTSEQSPKVREALHGFFAWHRSTQLPDYAELLVRAQAEVQSDITAESACRWGDALRARVDRLREPALPAAAAVVATLGSRQVRHLQQKFEETAVEFREEYLQDTPDERRSAAFKRTLDRLEELYGRFDEAQRTQVAQQLGTSPFDAQLWLAERRARNADIVQTLDTLVAQRTELAQVEATLRSLSLRATESPRPAYRAYNRALTDFNCQFAARIHNLTTPAQRLAAVRRLKGWEDDVRALAGSAARPVAALGR